MSVLEDLVEIVIKIPIKLYNDVKKLSELKRIDTRTVIVEALKEGIFLLKIREAIKRYVNGEVSLGKAAEIAGLSIWEFLDELKKRGIEIRYKEKHILHDLGAKL